MWTSSFDRPSSTPCCAKPTTSSSPRRIRRRPRGSSAKRSAVLINIGRGALVDEDALIRALQQKRLAGAALDVFRVEPPPRDSPLWEMPNVIMSPHSASTVTQENARITDLFCDNLRRYLGGQPLRNVLDTTKLY